MKMPLLIVSMFMAMKVAASSIKIQDAETKELQPGVTVHMRVYGLLHGQTISDSAGHFAVNTTVEKGILCFYD